MADLNTFYRIDNFIDTFALGHYARVLDALDRRTGRTVAFKVMRPEHLNPHGEVRWEYRAFANEANLLNRLIDSPHAVNLLDCGYIASDSTAPHDGEIESFQRDILGFVQAMDDFAARGWRPYLALENLPRARNLFYLMKTNRAGVRWRLPSEEGLSLAHQFGQMLQFAHDNGIVYLDHKLEHVYWDGQYLQVIDFNSSRQLPGDPNAPENVNYRRMDIHNLCVGILYPVFTGLAPQQATLKPQPGTWTDVEERYKNITTLDFGVEPTLSQGIRDLMQGGAALELTTVDAFFDSLYAAGAALGWDAPNEYTAPGSRDARAQLRAGLARLRAGQENLREARDLFREAAIVEGITPDMEDELRRLVKAVNDMLNHRVIP